jgi:Synergist-CTERM protein sorting domain-containing protein
MNQQMGNYIAALFEPVSMRSWAGKDLANMDIVLNKEMPFYRYENKDRITTGEAIEMPILDFTDFFLYNARAFDGAKLRQARESTRTSGFGQAIVLYGNELTDSTFKAYLPPDGTQRTWYIYNPASKKYTAKKVLFDSDMNRNYIVIDKLSLVSDGNGYYTFDMLATQVGDNRHHSSSGCNAGLAVLFVLPAALWPMAARRRK